MKTYEFVISIKELFEEDLADRIYGQCDDATVSSRSNGCTEVAFDRDAATIDEAMKSAINDLTQLGCSIEQIVIDSEAVLALTSASA